MCVSDKDCHIDHDRISLKDIHKMVPSIRELKTECQKVKVLYQDKLKKAGKVEKELQLASKQISQVKDTLTSTLLRIDTACELGCSINLESTEHDAADTMV